MGTFTRDVFGTARKTQKVVGRKKIRTMDLEENPALRSTLGSLSIHHIVVAPTLGIR